jgi:hypothetical protein
MATFLFVALAFAAALGFPLAAPARSAGAAPALTPDPRTDCLLALYDDEAMTRIAGLASGASKTLYLGIRSDATTPAQLTGIEFSITGLQAFDVVVEPRDNPTVILGTPGSPAGIDSVYGLGGMNIAWAQCLPGDRVLAQLTLVPKNGWPPAGSMMEVRRRYPPTNASLPYPVITDCDEPYYTARGVRGGRYLLGISGTPICSFYGSTDFGLVPVGSTATRTCWIGNTGLGVLQGSLSLTGANFELVDTDLWYTLLHGEEKQFTVRFAPPQAGQFLCTVLGAGCAPAVFSGGTTPTTPIATLHRTPSLLGDEVTVEAQVYVPANHAGGEPTGWIQDGSGRGIQVHGTGARAPVLNSTGNAVRVTGMVARAGTILRLDPVRVVTLISAGNPPLVPAVLSTHDAASADWEGTFVQVTGGVVSRRIDGTTMRYVVDDNMGSVTIVVPNPLALPDFPVGDVLTARGAGGYDGEYLVRVGNTTDAFLSVNPGCLGRRVIVGDVAGALGQQVEVPIRIQWNPRPIDAYGLRIAFDGSALRFVGSRCCALTAGWETCEARAVGRDTVVVGGFNPVPIPSNIDGDLMCLTFEILSCGGERHLEAFGLVDDLAGMGACSGAVSCTECLSDGDVTEDGLLTPQDAQCAFGIFLEGQALPPDCDAEGHCEIVAGDVNCDAVVTPGDAVEIFDRWLGGNSAPGHCFARPVASTEAFRCGAPVAESSSGQVALPIEMRAVPGPVAFGVDIDFDPAAAEFVELRRAPAATRWPALAARLASPGHLRVGGFDSRGTASDVWEEIASLVFRKTQGTLTVRNVTWRERIAGRGATHPETRLALDLEPPYPNPLRSGEVTLPLFIPAGATQDVVVGIHDVAGRLVRLLHAGGALPAGPTALSWDGTDDSGQRVAAGIYLVYLRSGGTTRERKLVVLQ